jgi:hypothetical protein
MKKTQKTKCGVCTPEHYERNNYFYQKSFTVRDMFAEQSYFNQKRYLINRMILGWGVVCGLDVCVPEGCNYLVVEPGLALDCCGREILVCERIKLTPDLVKEHCGQGDSEIEWALCLEYDDCKSERVQTCEGKQEYNRIRDHYRFRFYPKEEVCVQRQDESCCPAEYEGLPGGKQSIHGDLCNRIREGCPECEECACVVLATGKLTYDGKAGAKITEIDPCTYRKLVHRNDLLFELLDCFHGGLPHITDVNWKPAGELSFNEFGDLVKNQGLKVWFDQDMDGATVQDIRSCRLSLFSKEQRTMYNNQLFVPIDRIQYDETKRIATYWILAEWIKDEVDSPASELVAGKVLEFSLRGSMIHNKKGRALDAEWLRRFPTGNGLQGGDFVVPLVIGPPAGRQQYQAVKLDTF